MKRHHRDTLFRGIFKNPKNFLQLLEKCTGGKTSLTVDDIKPFDLDSEVSIRIRRNDVSFITKDNRLIILVEHQSTINPNMALRLFLYYVELLQLWIKLNEINLYSKQKISALPIPEFYVAYNGKGMLKEEVSVFSLSHTGIKLDIAVKIIDIRFENLKSKETENALTGYSYFYKVYDESKKEGMDNQEAFGKARKECMKQGYLTGFIEKEDFIMFYKDILDYDTQLRAEGRDEGRSEGRSEGIFDAAIKFLKKGMSLEDVVETLELNDSQIKQLEGAVI